MRGKDREFEGGSVRGTEIESRTVEGSGFTSRSSVDVTPPPTAGVL